MMLKKKRENKKNIILSFIFNETYKILSFSFLINSGRHFISIHFDAFFRKQYLKSFLASHINASQFNDLYC